MNNSKTFIITANWVNKVDTLYCNLSLRDKFLFKRCTQHSLFLDLTTRWKFRTVAIKLWYQQLDSQLRKWRIISNRNRFWKTQKWVLLLDLVEIGACDSTLNRWIKGDTAKTGKENEACENIDIKYAIDQRVDGGKTNYATSRKPAITYYLTQHGWKWKWFHDLDNN